MAVPRFRLTFLAPLALTGCALLPRLADPQVVSLAKIIHADAGTFFTGLSTKKSPECAFQANAGAYDHLAQLAVALKQHISANRGTPALVLASHALLRTLADARASHAAASAKVDDAGGLCMAPGAIALNAQAVSRASAAIAATQNAAGDQ